MDDRMIDHLIDLLVTLKHLPGKHDQSEHAKGGRRKVLSPKRARVLSGLVGRSDAGDSHASTTQVEQRLGHLTRKLRSGKIGGGHRSIETAKKRNNDIYKRQLRRSSREQLPLLRSGPRASSLRRIEAERKLDSARQYPRPDLPPIVRARRGRNASDN